MDGYKEDLGRLMAFVGLVAAELNMLGLELHQMRAWFEASDAEQTLCARERALNRVRFIQRQTRNVLYEVTSPPAGTDGEGPTL